MASACLAARKACMALCLSRIRPDEGANRRPVIPHEQRHVPTLKKNRHAAATGFPYVQHVNIVVPQMKAKCYKYGISEAQEGLFVASIEGPPRAQ